MKKHLSQALRFALGCALILPALTIAGRAQTTTFTYQGSLTLGGMLANGSYDLQFKLYDQLTGGTLQGSPDTVTVSVVTVTAGVFSVDLNFGSTAFPGAARYLEISVRPAGGGGFTTLSPRQQMTSTPHAIRSLSAAGADTATTATNATNFTGSLSGDVTGTQSATVVSMVGGVTASNLAGGATLANNATDANTPGTIVKRDASGNFTAGTISATAFSGSGLNLTSLNASNLTSGTLSDSRLSSNVALLNTANTFTANQTVNANLIQSGSLVQFTPTNGLVASGTVGSGSIPATGAGARMMWYPNKAAFRAGQVTGTQWDDSSVGTGSAALGKNNTAGGDNAFAAGESATAGGERSFSFNGTASGVGAIALGSSAQATNDDALALGSSSRAQGLLSTAIGPCLASGSFATCIGLRTNATGNFSLVLGRDASSSSDSTNATTYSGVIALGDGSTTAPSHTMYATANNQFNVRAAGGIRFFSACCNYDTGVTISAGGGAWNSISDRNLKENFQPIAPREILRGVLGLPISTWNYKSQDRSIRHIGAMAQDFFATFKVGENDRTITTIDPDGVALAAIQGLHEELKDRDARIGLQQQQLEKLQEQVQQQQAVIDGLKQLLCAQKTQAAVCRQKQPKQ